MALYSFWIEKLKQVCIIDQDNQRVRYLTEEAALKIFTPKQILYMKENLGSYFQI